MSQERAKVCPRCRKADLTSFSTCRFCGTNYDVKMSASADESKSILKLNLLVAGWVIFVICSIIFLIVCLQKMERARQLDLVKKGIVTVDRPRLIEFYTIHCPACQSYKPIIEQCRQKYGETIDFQSVDFDDEKNIKLNIGLWVTAVPTTFVFNRRGEEVFEKTGCLDFATLDKQLRDPDLFK